MSQALINKFNKLSKTSKKFNDDSSVNFKNITDPNVIANKTISTLGIDLQEKQKILEILDIQKKLEIIISHLDNELELMSVEKELEEESKTRWKKLRENII